MQNKLIFKVLGGGNEIGANSFLFSYGKDNFVMDCGLHPRKKGREIFPNYEIIKDITVQNLMVTHAHNDHIGALPYFLNLFPYSNIYMTKPTHSIAEITLANTAFLMEREFEDEWDKSQIKYYTEETLNLIPMIIKQRDYNEKTSLNEQINFQFTDAGHLLGSAGVLLNVENKRVFFTGDINFRSQKLIPKAELPKRKVDVLITETTNGLATTMPDYDREQERLAQFINKITNRGGSVLIPVFALGKASEMLARIDEMMMKNKIPHVPVYFSSLAKALNNVYDDFNYTVPRTKQGFKLSDIDIQILKREDIQRGEFYKKPGIILATSGMVIEGTYSYKIAKNFLRNRNFGIAMCGYCDPETPGYRIKNAEKFEIIYLDKYGVDTAEVLCHIENFSFSSHTTKEGIMHMVETLDPELVALVHGDEPAIDSVGKEIMEKFPNKRVLAPEKYKDYQLL